MHSWKAFILIIVSGLIGSACGDDGLFLSCPFDTDIDAICDPVNDENSLTEDKKQFTCVVKEHPQCPQDVCIQWKGSNSVCTRSCTVDEDCPSGSRCVVFSVQDQESYCVQDKDL